MTTLTDEDERRIRADVTSAVDRSAEARQKGLDSDESRFRTGVTTR